MRAAPTYNNSSSVWRVEIAEQQNKSRALDRRLYSQTNLHYERPRPPPVPMCLTSWPRRSTSLLEEPSLDRTLRTSLHFKRQTLTLGMQAHASERHPCYAASWTTLCHELECQT